MKKLNNRFSTHAVEENKILKKKQTKLKDTIKESSRNVLETTKKTKEEVSTEKNAGHKYCGRNPVDNGILCLKDASRNETNIQDYSQQNIQQLELNFTT